MNKTHTVRKGDCIESIAKKYGFFPDTLWNHAENRKLHDLRKDPGALLPGDVVVVPDLKQKNVTGNTEQRHSFRRKGIPARMRIKFLKPVVPEPEEEAASSSGDYDPSVYEEPPPQVEQTFEPLANAPYVLKISGHFTEGSSDGDGMVDAPIPAHATSGKITFHQGTSDEVSYDLAFGTLDPIDTVNGLRKRLANLGYNCVPEGNEMEPTLQDALIRFQSEQGLTANGTIDQATKDKVKEIYGS